MRIVQVELKFDTSSGEGRAAALHPPQQSAAVDGVALEFHSSEEHGHNIADLRVSNRSSDPIRLVCALFTISSGLKPRHDLRFLKHGFQSWSASNGHPVGISEHRRDTAPGISRLMHQSEKRRPSEFPEGMSSELFTIVDDGERRLLAGFIRGDLQYATITVYGANRIVARALLDHTELAPGDEIEIAPLLCQESTEPAYALAESWASRMGREMSARVSAPYQRGWCSWYHYFHGVTEEAIRTNLSSLAQMRDLFPLELVQLDDGYQSAIGDWDAPNAKFPGGLKRLAADIRATGFVPGIWTAPFLATAESALMQSHPEWFIRRDSGEPVRAVYNPAWTRGDDKFAYALDASHPALRDHLETLFRKFVEDYGYGYLKLDFVYSGSVEGQRHDRRVTRAQALRSGLEAIRRGAGENAFILGCGCPIGPAVGIVDGMRIGPDVAPFWNGSSGDPSTALALKAAIARSWMHRRLWLNDPDCLMIRTSETSLTFEERNTLATTIAGTGQMMLISDDMNLLNEEDARLYRASAAIGEEIDQFARGGGVPELDLLQDHDLQMLSWEAGDEIVVLAVNLGDESRTLETAQFGSEVKFATPGRSNEPASAIVTIPPHGALLLRVGSIDDAA